MSDWRDLIFGNLPSGPPARPPSRGATFGQNYQGLPTSQNIDDRRQQPTDQAYWMRRAPAAASTDYPPSQIDDSAQLPAQSQPNTPGYDRMALARFIGPNPPIASPPMTPGDPGWTPPPSPSGPHNPQGDPNRPGYGGAIGLPNTAASQFPPQQGASQPSYQQLINFLQSQRGGAS